MKNKKINHLWFVSQPPFNEDIVVFVNSIKPSYHFIKWFGEGLDWDIKINDVFYVGPRNFEGGSQFIPDIKDKEFYWMPKKTFIKHFCL